MSSTNDICMMENSALRSEKDEMEISLVKHSDHDGGSDGEEEEEDENGNKKDSDSTMAPGPAPSLATITASKSASRAAVDQLKQQMTWLMEEDRQWMANEIETYNRHKLIEEKFYREAQKLPTPALRQFLGTVKVISGKGNELVLQFMTVTDSGERKPAAGNGTAAGAAAGSEIAECKKLLDQLAVALANNDSAAQDHVNSFVDDSTRIESNDFEALGIERVRIIQEIKKQSARFKELESSASVSTPLVSLQVKWESNTWEKHGSAYASLNWSLQLVKPKQTSNSSGTNSISTSANPSSASPSELEDLYTIEVNYGYNDRQIENSGGQDLLEWLRSMGVLPCKDETDDDADTTATFIYSIWSACCSGEIPYLVQLDCSDIADNLEID